jgi:uncharacterized protein (TIGR02145 family)
MNRVKLFIFTAIFIATAFTFSCSSGDDSGNNPPIVGGGDSSSSDPSLGSPSSSSVGISHDYGQLTYGGQTYKTIRIGNQTWMAENLNYRANGTYARSECYNKNESNCLTHGRLYDWPTARDACPSGWHLPTQAEWNTLSSSVGGSSVDGKRLKAKEGWDGDDTYGFKALPGGYGNDNDFGSINSFGNWWTATMGPDRAYYLIMQSGRDDISFSDGRPMYYFHSVRCVKD